MKILVCCGSGLGSSFMIEMNIKKALQEIGVEAEVNHSDLSASRRIFTWGHAISLRSSLGSAARLSRSTI